ncbi:hypothetical protein PGB90_003384 [Kerria lacca]
MARDKKDEENEEILGSNKDKVTHSEAFDIFEKTITYVEQQNVEDITAADVIILRKWRDIAASKRIFCSTQHRNTRYQRRLDKIRENKSENIATSKIDLQVNQEHTKSCLQDEEISSYDSQDESIFHKLHFDDEETFKPIRRK